MNEKTVLQAIESRRSVGEFKKQPIPETVLNAVIDAACEAPSSWNLQPWRIIAVKSAEGKERLSEAGFTLAQIRSAPVVLVFVAAFDRWHERLPAVLKTATETGAWTKYPKEHYATIIGDFQKSLGGLTREHAVKDTMIAAAYASLAAESIGLSSHFIHGWKDGDYLNLLGVNSTECTALAAMLCLGYSDSKPVHPGRLARSSVVFQETLSTPYTYQPQALRSPKELMFGLVHLARLVDKIRLAEQGFLPGYNYLSVGFDKMVVEFLGISPEAFVGAVKACASDKELEAWIKVNTQPHSADEKKQFNEMILSIGGTDERRRARLTYLRDCCDPTRTDLTTFVDIIDLAEGRL